MPPALLPKYDYTRVALDQSFKYFSWFSGGLGHIDIEDWKCHTRLKHCNPETQIVRWFWEILDEYSEEMRARLLQFVTGSSRVSKLFSTLPKFFVVCRFNPFFPNEQSQKTDLEFLIVFCTFLLWRKNRHKKLTLVRLSCKEKLKSILNLTGIKSIGTFGWVFRCEMLCVFLIIFYKSRAFWN